MAKLTLKDITTNRLTSINNYNSNNDLVEAAIENTLSRDGTTPNQMEADFDLNSNALLNGGAASFSSLTLAGVPVTTATVQEEPIETIYSTRALAILGNVTQDLIKTLGYTTAHDGGGAYYKKVASEPSHAGKFQNAAGTWYEYYADESGRKHVNLRAFGAVGDGVATGDDNDKSWTGTDDTTAIAAAENAADVLGYPRYIPEGNFIVSGSITRNDSSGLQQSSDVCWYGEHPTKSVIATKYIMGPFDNLWGYIGTYDSETSTTVVLDGDIAKGEDTLVVNDASLLTSGDWIELIDHSQAVWNPLTAGPIYASGDIAAVADGITSSTVDFTTDSRYAAGKWIYVGGDESGRWRFASGAGSTWAKIQSVTSGKVSFVAGTFEATWAIDAGTGKTIRVRFDDDRECRVGYHARVKSINTGTNTVELYGSHEFDLKDYTGIDADSGLPRGTTIRRHTAPAQNFYFENFTVSQHQLPYTDDATNPSTDIDVRSAWFQMLRCHNVNFRGVTFDHPQSYEFECSECVGVTVIDTRHYLNDLDGMTRYTLKLDGGAHGLIRGVQGYGGRHIVDGNPGGQSKLEQSHVIVDSCLAVGTYGAAFGTHYGARDWLYSSCKAVGNHVGDTLTKGAGQAGFQPRGRNMKIENCTVDGYERGAYVVYVEDIVISDCRFNNNEHGIEIHHADKVTIQNCDFDENETTDIRINDDARYNAMGGLVIKNNISKSRPSSAAYSFYSSGASATIDWGDIWLFLNNYAQFATTKYTGIPLDQIHLFNRTGGDHTFYSDEADKELTIAPGSSTFQRARLITEYNDLSIVTNGATEAVRFEDDRVTFYLPPIVPTYTVAEANAILSGLDAGSLAYISNGDAGSGCLGITHSGAWKVISLGASISAT